MALINPQPRVQSSYTYQSAHIVGQGSLAGKPAARFPGAKARLAIAVAPGALFAGAFGIFGRHVLVDAAPMFAIGGFGIAAVIMSVFSWARRRDGR